MSHNMRQYTDLSRPEGPLKDHIGVEFEEKAPVWVCGYCVTAEGIDEHDGVPIRRALDTCLSQEEHPKDEKSWKGVIRNNKVALIGPIVEPHSAATNKAVAATQTSHDALPNTSGGSQSSGLKRRTNTSNEGAKHSAEAKSKQQPNGYPRLNTGQSQPLAGANGCPYGPSQSAFTRELRRIQEEVPSLLLCFDRQTFFGKSRERTFRKPLLRDMSGDVATFKRIRREFDETLPSLTAEFIRCMSWIWQRLPLYGFVRSHYDSAWNTTTPRTSSSKSAIGRYWASMICWLSWLFGWLSWISRWLSWMSGWVSWIVGTVTTGLLWMLTLFGVMWLLSELYCVFTPKVTSVRLTSFYMRNGWALPIHDENFWGPYDRSSFSPVGVSTGPASEPKKKDDNQELQGKESSARPQAALDPEYLLRCFENPEACEQDVINWEYLATRTSISLVQANPAIKATGDTLWRGWGLEIVSETDRVRIFYAFWMVALGLGTVLLATSTWKEKLENCFALSNLLLTLIVGGFQARSAHK